MVDFLYSYFMSFYWTNFEFDFATVMILFFVMLVSQIITSFCEWRDYTVYELNKYLKYTPLHFIGVFLWIITYPHILLIISINLSGFGVFIVFVLMVVHVIMRLFKTPGLIPIKSAIYEHQNSIIKHITNLKNLEKEYYQTLKNYERNK